MMRLEVCKVCGGKILLKENRTDKVAEASPALIPCKSLCPKGSGASGATGSGGVGGGGKGSRGGGVEVKGEEISLPLRSSAPER